MLGERASLGTLLELGNCALDQLRDLLVKAPTAKPADKGKAILTGTYETKEDVHAGISVARRTLEVVLTYSVTQLALYLNKPDAELGNRDVEFDEAQAGAMDVTPATKAASLDDTFVEIVWPWPFWAVRVRIGVTIASKSELWVACQDRRVEREV